MHRMRKLHTSLLALGAVALMPQIGISPTLAQQQGARPAALEEIVVTSRKRGDELLQEVPATISAISGNMLDRMGALDFDQFAYQIPGLTFNDEGPGQKRYVIRGVQSAGQQQTAVYYDEVPLPGIQGAGGNSGSQTSDLKLFDMERVEVLKGPQGTTFGANSQAGTVRFITRKPVMNEVEGRVKVGGHKIDGGGIGGDVYGMINMPIVEDTLSLRAVAYYDNEAGYIDNVRLGTEDINSSETIGFRGALRFEPTDRLSIDAMVWLQNRRQDGPDRYTPYNSFSSNPANTDFVDNDLNPLQNIRDYAFYQTGDLVVGDYTQGDMPDDQQIFSATLNYDFDWASLVMNGSYYKRDFGFKRDSTWVILRLADGFAKDNNMAFEDVRPDLYPALTDQTQDVEQKSFEARLNSTSGSPLQWMGGVFYRDRQSYFRSFVPVVNEQGVPFDPGTPPTGYQGGAPGEGIAECHPCVTARENDRSIKEIAFFGEVSYELTDQLEIMGGLRWFEAKQSDVGETIFPFALFGGALPPADVREFKEDKLIKKFQVSYRATEDAVVYALASQGFRLGGTNQQGVVAVPLGYEADGLWNYEVGAKTSWLDNRLIFNLAAFQINWDDLQVAGNDPTGAFGFIGNAGKARMRGLEAEFSARPTNSLELTGGMSWLFERELTEDQITDEVVAPGRAGDKLPYVPGFTANATAQFNYITPVEGWEGYLRGEFNYRGKSNSELNTTSRFNRVQNSYEIVNLRAGFLNLNSDLDLTFYVENVFDRRGDVRVRTEDSLITFKWTNQPRTIGMDISKRF